MKSIQFPSKAGQSLNTLIFFIALLGMLGGVTSLILLSFEDGELSSNRISSTSASPRSTNQQKKWGPLSVEQNGSFLETLPGKLMTIPVCKGQNIQVKYINPGVVAEAVGPDGVTQNALAGLDQMIQQFEQMPTPDTSVIDSLKALSQKGRETQMYQIAYSNFLKSGGHSPNQTVFSDWQKFQEYQKPLVILANGHKMSLFELRKNLGTLQASDAVTQFPPSKFMESFDATLFLAQSHNYVDDSLKYQFFLAPKNKNNQPQDNSFTHMFIKITPDTNGMPGYIAQLAETEREGIFTKYPGLRPFVVDVLSKDLYVASFSTAISNDLKAVQGFSQRVGWRSDDICLTSHALSCQNLGSKILNH
ncbi:MAG: hypothetical protein K2X66_07895 [Cyanobacteria bacterium]|nr:hypothetical protein [Cyanobacteriota bacterium]